MAQVSVEMTEVVIAMVTDEVIAMVTEMATVIGLVMTDEMGKTEEMTDVTVMIGGMTDVMVMTGGTTEEMATIGETIAVTIGINMEGRSSYENTLGFVSFFSCLQTEFHTR